MAKRALIVGIDTYDHDTVRQLDGCVNDAREVTKRLSKHADSRPNYDCITLDSEKHRIDREELIKRWEQLFSDFSGDLLFYFAGHAMQNTLGGHLITQDSHKGSPGPSMNDLLTLANNSDARSVLLILDCCYSGSLGNLPHLPNKNTQIREGVTILAASSPRQLSNETGERGQPHGVFTSLLLAALDGAAADVRGIVSTASIYAYVEQTLGAWQQRPMYKMHTDRLHPVRLCQPAVPDDLLRQLPELFTTASAGLRLTPAHEHTTKQAEPDKVAVFDQLKVLRNARLLTTEDHMDLYYLALESKQAFLTPLGQFYWLLAQNGRV